MIWESYASKLLNTEPRIDCQRKEEKRERQRGKCAASLGPNHLFTCQEKQPSQQQHSRRTRKRKRADREDWSEDGRGRSASKDVQREEWSSQCDSLQPAWRSRLQG